MTTVHISPSWPETNCVSMHFVLDKGTFTDAALAAVIGATGGHGCFNGGRRNYISVTYAAGHHPRPAQVALTVLKQRMPDTRFTFSAISLKGKFGDLAEFI